MIKDRTLSTLLLGLALVASCSSTPSVKTLINYQENQQQATVSNGAYIIAPGDVLAINVWKEPELTTQVLVRADGMISLPLVHEIKADGLTCAELRNKLTEKFKDYLDFPELAVVLMQSAKQIYVLGEVGGPGAQPLVQKKTILEAIAIAGGPSIWADTDNIRLIRNVNGIEKHFIVDYDAIISGKDLNQNILLQPGDVIYVPR